MRNKQYNLNYTGFVSNSGAGRWLSTRICLLIGFYLLFSINSQTYSQETEQNSTSAQTLLSQSFEIASEKSVLRLFIGRAGVLSKMGHNHVIVNRNITGDINLGSQPQLSTAQIKIPVEKMVVDDAEERKRSGSQYVSIPSDKDKTNTRINMLGSAVLDGDRYPDISITISSLSLGETQGLFSITLSLKDNLISLELPASISKIQDTLVVDAAFTLNHTDLGLKPYSVMGGMLKVASDIRIELHVEALAKR
jgi:hypothetical protein